MCVHVFPRFSVNVSLCVRVCSQVLFGGVGQRRGKVSKITKSVWQLTISGFWLRFVDMTSLWVSPKLTPGILGCLAVPQTEQPISWQNQAAQAPSPHCLPCLPAETPVIRVWATCRKNTYREHSVMDITNYAAILLMDATSSCCNDTHIHNHGQAQPSVHTYTLTHKHRMHMWMQWDHYRTKSGLILTYAYYLPECHVSSNTKNTWCCLLLLFWSWILIKVLAHKTFVHLRFISPFTKP